jgi:hypothetical protein
VDISRHGSRRYRGTTSVISGLRLKIGAEYQWQNNVRWDAANKQIIIDAGWIPHTDGKTKHDYQIRLSLEDVAALVTLLGHAGSASDADKLRDLLSKNVPALVKLLACATGLVPTPMAEDKAAAVKPG